MQMDCHINGFMQDLLLWDIMDTWEVSFKTKGHQNPKHHSSELGTRLPPWQEITLILSFLKKKNIWWDVPPFIPLLIQTVQKIGSPAYKYIYIEYISKYYAWEHTSSKMFHKQSKVPGINKDSARARGLRETWVFLERWTHAKTQPTVSAQENSWFTYSKQEIVSNERTSQQPTPLLFRKAGRSNFLLLIVDRFLFLSTLVQSITTLISTRWRQTCEWYSYDSKLTGLIPFGRSC